MSKTKKIIITAVLLAVRIILSRFLSIKTPIVKVSFSFLPAMLCATWLGVKWTFVLNVLADLIGATLFPVGPYFFGYTISSALAAIVYGLLLYQKNSDSFSNKTFILRVFLSVVIVSIFINLGLNTVWTSITAGKAFKVLLATRTIKELITIPINIFVFIFVEKILRVPFDKYVRSNDD